MTTEKVLIFCVLLPILEKLLYNSNHTVVKELFAIDIMEIFPYVTLRVFRDTRFKQGCLSFQLVSQMEEKSAARNALLPSVLLRGTKSCPDLRAITARFDTLYGAAVSPLVRRVGDYQTTGLYCGFMDDRFALPGDQVLKPMVAFLEELLLDSPLESGGFLTAFVESEKKNLISTIDSERNDKRLYAQSRLLEEMCRGDSFGLPRLGRREDVGKLTPELLLEDYRHMLRTCPIEIVYAGSEDAGRVAELIMPLLTRLQRAGGPLLRQTPFHGTGEKRDVRESMDVAQGKLGMGFVTPITNRDPEFAAMQVLNVVFGGGMTSKLFQNVREKLSLCYSIGSSYYSTKGIVTVYAGIDFEQEQRTRDEILHQLDTCCQGDIALEELTAAKKAIVSSLRATHDSPGAIEGFYATAALSGLDMTPLEYIGVVEAVTLEQAAAAARTLRLHTTFFLQGGSQ